MQALNNLLRLARPGHWIKNFFVFAPLVFSRRFTDAAAVLESAMAFAAFCLASSAIYALNDVMDRKEDARHPTKCRRPVASGQVSPTAAIGLALVLAACAAVLAAALRPAFALWLAAYLVIMLAYVLGLKRVAILDVLILAVGFVIRACAGGAADRHLDQPVAHPVHADAGALPGFCEARGGAAGAGRRGPPDPPRRVVPL